MEIPLSTPALLFPAIAILMLGYVNRYLGTAGVIRSFKKDYDSGYTHTDVVRQLTVLKKRIDLSRDMIMVAVIALICACVSMLLIFMGFGQAGAIAFGLSLAAMVVSMGFSVWETALSNKSLLVEIDDVFEREAKKK